MRSSTLPWCLEVYDAVHRERAPRLALLECGRLFEVEGGVVIELPWGKVHIALKRSERREAFDFLGESRRHVLLLSPRAPLGRVAKRRFDRRGSGRRILLENSRGNGAVGPVVCLAGTLRTDLGEEGESEVRRESSPQLLDAVFGKSLVVYVGRAIVVVLEHDLEVRLCVRCAAAPLHVDQLRHELGDVVAVEERRI